MPCHPDLLERSLHRIESRGLHDGFNFFHGELSFASQQSGVRQLRRPSPHRGRLSDFGSCGLSDLLLYFQIVSFFPVLRQIQALDFLLLGDAQADGPIHRP